MGLAFRQAWHATWANFPLWLAVVVVALILMCLSCATVVGIFVLFPVFVWGSTYFYLNAISGCAEFNDLFAGFSNYRDRLTAMLGLGFVWILLSLVGEAGSVLMYVANGSDELSIVGVVWSLVWACAVLSRFYFAFYFVVDRGYGPVESLRASWEATKGQYRRLLLLILTTVLTLLAGVAAFIAGVVPAIIVIELAWAAGYRQLVALQTEAA